MSAARLTAEERGRMLYAKMRREQLEAARALAASARHGRPALLLADDSISPEALAWIAAQPCYGKHSMVCLMEYVRPVFDLFGRCDRSVLQWNRHSVYHFSALGDPRCVAVIDALRAVPDFWRWCFVGKRSVLCGEFNFEVG